MRLTNTEVDRLDWLENRCRRGVNRLDLVMVGVYLALSVLLAIALRWG